jgi:hypothetical protein
MQSSVDGSLDPRAARLLHTNRMHDTLISKRNLRKSQGKSPRDHVSKPSTRTYRYFDADVAKSTPKYKSESLITRAIGGSVPPINFPDLKYRSEQEIRAKMRTLFEELPAEGFLPDYKNPCWLRSGEKLSEISAGRLPTQLVCLPYAYLLGMPKCGTSDLFERLSKHPLIKTPHRKEVRWFTRGEFTTHVMQREGDFPSEYNDPLPRLLAAVDPSSVHNEKLLGSESSIYSFTGSFNEATRSIALQPAKQGVITIDGGPHTLWWPTQSPDGELLPEDIPAAQLIREIQPNAKFVITLTDPVKRMYSDYYFLNDDLRPVNPRNSASSRKSAEEFHQRSQQQIEKFEECVRTTNNDLLQDLHLAGSIGAIYLEENWEADDEEDALWLRASQM